MLSRVGNLTSDFKPPPGMIVAGLGNVADRGDVHLPARGGLRPPDFRRVREYVLAHLAENVSNRVLAGLVGLSAFYFSRAFKQTRGMPPPRLLLHNRVAPLQHLDQGTHHT